MRIKFEFLKLQVILSFIISLITSKRDLTFINIGNNDPSVSYYLKTTTLPWYNRQSIPIENKTVNFSVFTKGNTTYSAYGFFMESNEVFVNVDTNSSKYSHLSANLTSIVPQKPDSKIWLNYTAAQNLLFPFTALNYTKNYFNNTGWVSRPYSPPYDIECNYYEYDMYYYPRVVNRINLTNITNYKSLSIGIDKNNKLKLIVYDIGDLNEFDFFSVYNHTNFTTLRNLSFHSVKIKKNIILLQSFDNIFILNIFDTDPSFYSTSFSISYYPNNNFSIGSKDNFVYDFENYGSVFFLATSQGLLFYTNDRYLFSGPYVLKGTSKLVKFNGVQVKFIPSKLFATKDTLIVLMAYKGIKILDLSYIYRGGTFNNSYNFDDRPGESEFYHPNAFTMDDFINDYTGKSFIGLGIDQRFNSSTEFFIELMVEGWGQVSIFKVFNSGPNPILYDNIRSDDWYTYILDKYSESVYLIKRGRNPDLQNTIFKLPLKLPYQVKDFNKTEETKAYLIYDKFSGNYTVVYTNKNVSNMLLYLYEIDAAVDCYVNTPGVYNLSFEGKAEICDPTQAYNVQNYCGVNSIVTINALPSNNSNIDEKRPKRDKDGDDDTPVLAIVVIIISSALLILIASVIIFKYRCFIHLCNKKTGHTQLENQQYQRTGNDFDVQVDQK